MILIFREFHFFHEPKEERLPRSTHALNFHKPKQLYVLGKLRFCSIKPMKMIEI